MRQPVYKTLKALREHLVENGWTAPMDRVDRLEHLETGVAVESGYVLGEVWVKVYMPDEREPAASFKIHKWNVEEPTEPLDEVLDELDIRVTLARGVQA
jgi:hypothetical protein